MTKLRISTAYGDKFEVTGENYRYDEVEKIHYLNGASYPASIVESVEVEK